MRECAQVVTGGIHASPRNNWARMSSAPTLCFLAVARKERKMANARVPSSLWKQPLIFL